MGIIAKLGSLLATTLPGSPKARMALSRISSEPQPVTMHSGVAPTNCASSSLSSAAYNDG